MYGLYIHDVKGTCSPITDTMCVKYKKKITVVLGLKSRVVTLTISLTDLWHKRLGHISPHRLSFIAHQFLNFYVQSSHVCPICPLAKQSRLPFSSSVISSIKPFEIIHCDIWGRYRHPSIFGAYYFLLPLMITHVSHGYF